MRSLRNCGPHCDRTLQILLKTFFDIFCLRKGPENLPHSWLLFGIVLVASIVVELATTEIVLPDFEQLYIVVLALKFVAFAYFTAVLAVSGQLKRGAQTLTALAGTDLLLNVVLLSLFVLGGVFADRETLLAVISLLVYWSVPVQGYIISCAIQQHLAIGIALAFVALLLAETTFQYIRAAA